MLVENAARGIGGTYPLALRSWLINLFGNGTPNWCRSWIFRASSFSAYSTNCTNRARTGWPVSPKNDYGGSSVIRDVSTRTVDHMGQVPTRSVFLDEPFSERSLHEC